MDTMGAVVTIEELFSNKKIEFKISSGGNDRNFGLLANRKYVIPEYQRELRWEEANVKQLIKDVKSRVQFLGNIILAERENDNSDNAQTEYEIIDGQQRITTIYLILKFLKEKYAEQLDLINNCILIIENFLKFDNAIEINFTNYNKEIIASDKLVQREKYAALWESIRTDSVLNSKTLADAFIRNLRDCEVNLILSTSKSRNIVRFIDVNTKGKHLDDEDIFKGFVFLQDSRNEIKKLWSNLKIQVARLESIGVHYPILTLIEQYLYCELYKNGQFDGVIFNQHFKITKTKNSDFYNEQHIIEALKDNAFVMKMLQVLISYIELCCEIVSSIHGQGVAFMKQFNPASKLDDNDYFIYHNFIKKVLKDTDNVPKALILKYYIEILYDCTGKTKSDYDMIFALYTLAFLFTIFTNKKSSGPIYNIIKQTDWRAAIIKEIKSYKEDKSFTDKKLQSRYRIIGNLEEECYEYRAKTMATLYNFFEVKGGSVSMRAGCGDCVKDYLASSNFTTEHFLVNKSKTIQYINNGKKINIKIPGTVSKFSNSLFNFIFINKEDNSKIENLPIGDKLEYLDSRELKCAYSQYYIAQITEIIKNPIMIASEDSKEQAQNKVDTFYNSAFVEKYIEIANRMYSKFFERFIKETDS